MRLAGPFLPVWFESCSGHCFVFVCGLDGEEKMGLGVRGGLCFSGGEFFPDFFRKKRGQQATKNIKFFLKRNEFQQRVRCDSVFF